RQVSPELTARHALAPLPAANPAAARRFMPDNVLGLRAEGEFRQVVSVFLNLRELPAGAEGDAFLARFFALLERHGGYLCRIGRIGAQDDGATALLFWGAPVSFEHDLRRALDFLAELRRESPAPLRAGVTSQLAYAGFVGADIHAEYTCYGAAVNLAARLMVRAEWGEALLDEDAAHQARATHRCLPRGAVRLKGFAAEQPVFALQDSRDWRPEPERELVGRGRELGRLRELLAPLRAGRGAGTILVTGEAGMGKSRLLAAAREGGPVAWLRCQADQVARESLHPFRAFLRHHFAFSLELSGDENLGLFQFGMESLGAAVPDPALRRELEAAAPALAGLLDLPWPDQPPAGNGDSLAGASPAPEGQERFAAAVNALKTLFKAESLCQPVVVEVEDGHWLDGDSLACLHHLGRNIADYPLAIVVAAREAPAGLAAAGQSIPTITLRPLDAAELAQLAAQVLGGPASREHLVALAERSEGNPYLAEQLLLADMDDQIADARVTTQHDDDSGLPATARALLTARIDRLEPAVRHAVQVAAILGREVAPELLRAMLDNDPALPDQLRAAAAAGIWQATAAGQLLFSHDLLRDAAYDMQLRSWRRRMHGRAAALLAPAGEPGLV
ncbi:MAG TPA: AAA family ATPase, partial [Herpetosiphonaceae bacterium]